MKHPASVTLVHVPLFLGLSIAWVLALSLGIALWFLAAGLPTEDPLAVLDAAGMGLLSILQIVGILGVAVGLSLLVPSRMPPPEPDDDRPEGVRRLRAAFPFRATPWPFLAAGTFGGLVVWLFPSFLAEQLMKFFPDWPSTLELITELLQRSSGVPKLVLIVTIAVSAPIVEELIFRGYLWRVIEVGAGRWGALVGTTILFALYHMDPIHVVSLLPTAIFLGWLRLASTSIVPPILAHFVNNALGVLLATALPTDPSAELGLAPALVGLAATLAIAAGATALSSRTRAPTTARPAA